jgi:hypothetical protein
MQAHGAQCQWVNDIASSADPLPGCPTCRDEGAAEPLLLCSYTIGPGAHVNAKEYVNVCERMWVCMWVCMWVSGV